MSAERAAWLEFIYYRDMLYLLAFVAAAAAMYWYRFSQGRLWPVYAVAGCGLTVAGLGWGAAHLW
jgi:hypothetical protein